MADDKAVEVVEVPDSGKVLDRDINEWVSGWQTFFRQQKTIVFIDAKVFNDVLTSFTSSIFSCGRYRKFDLLTKVTDTGTPTDIVIHIDFSDNGIDWYKLMNGPFGDIRYSAASSPATEIIQGIINSPYIRVRGVATGTTAANYFTLTSKINFTQ